MRVYDEHGNPIPMSNEAIFNDMNQTRRYDNVPDEALGVVILIPAADGNLRLGVVPVEVVKRGGGDPLKEALAGSAGTSMKAAAADHTHPTRAIGSVITLNAQGRAEWRFSRSFDEGPAVSAIPMQPLDADPIFVHPYEYIVEDGKFVGVRYYGFRMRRLPVLQQVTGILSAVITGVNALVTAISGFIPYDRTGLNGVQVHVVARERL